MDIVNLYDITFKKMGKEDERSAGGRFFYLLFIEGRRVCGQNEITVIRIKRTNRAHSLRELFLHPIIVLFIRPLKGKVFPVAQ